MEEQVKIGVEQALVQQQKKEKEIGDLEAVMEMKQRKKEKGAKDKKMLEATHPAKVQAEKDVVMVDYKTEEG